MATGAFESILGTVTGISEVRDKQPEAWFAFILAILIAFLLWSLYFDMMSEQETKTGYGYMQWLIFLHFPLLVSFSIAGACIKVLLSDMEAGFPQAVSWMFCAALATILIMIVGLTRIMKEEEEDRSYIRPVSKLLVIIAICLLLVPLLAGFMNTLGFFALVSFILLVPVLIGIRSWVRYKFYSEK